MVRHTVFAAVASALLASCSTLPAGGPSSSAIESAAEAETTARYELIVLTEPVVGVLSGRSSESFSDRFAGAGGGSDVIGIGDAVTVTIWEAGNGGLFSSAAGLEAGTKSATIPEQPVSTDGTITIPYAGTVRAAGRTPTAVKASIEEALTGKAIEPQVLVNVTRSVYNTVTVTGEVTRGGRIPLSGRGDRVLDVIAAAGGVGAPVHEVFVQLARKGRTARVALQRIVDDPSQNVTLAAGDTLTLVRDPQTFSVFGATGDNTTVPFNATGITLEEALGRVGGLTDTRADPGGVFVYRFEPADLVRRLVPDSRLAAAGGTVPVIYRLDLRDPNGLFLAKGFPVFDKDVVYVSNARSVELQKFLGLLQSTTASARNTSGFVQDFGN